MTVFHGSEFKIEKPYVGGGKSTNDYGSGFYCTESMEERIKPGDPRL